MRRIASCVFLFSLLGCAPGVVDRNGPDDTQPADAGIDARGRIPADASLPDGPDAMPVENLALTFITEPAGGEFAPEHVVATWIEDADGNFIATIDQKVGIRGNRLVAWKAKAGPNDIDAITGATQDIHSIPIVVTWNIPAQLPDGLYTIRMETADGNSVTADQNNQGTFSFDRNGTASSQSETVEGYPDVSIEYSGRF